VYLCFMWAHPGKQLLFMGQEFGQPSEWSEERGLDWWALDQPAHQGIKSLVAEMNRLYTSNTALYELDHQSDGFSWIDGGHAEANLLSFIRRDSKGQEIVVVLNFSGNPHHDFRLAFPSEGKWDELLNTDSEIFGGSGVGNFGSITAISEPSHGQPCSALVSVPPLGGIWFKKAAG
jgi:1,4-alpha-glucan branching enzyme